MATSMPLEGIDRILASLAEPRAIAAHEEARLVVGPTGAFVVLPGEDNLCGSAQRAHDLARETRDALAEHLSWVPFVDAVVVCDRCRSRDHTAATVVPFDLLPDMLREGTQVIDETLLAEVRELLRNQSLSVWRLARLAGDARIDLCDPTEERPVTTPIPD